MPLGYRLNAGCKRCCEGRCMNKKVTAWCVTFLHGAMLHQFQGCGSRCECARRITADYFCNCFFLATDSDSTHKISNIIVAATTAVLPL